MAPAAGVDAYRTQAVQTASGPQLLVMLYERMTADLLVAADALDARGDLYVASEALIHAQQIVVMLRSALDPGGFTGGQELLAVYGFLERELVAANLAKDPARIRGCLRVVEPLRAAWREAVDQVERGLVALAR